MARLKLKYYYGKTTSFGAVKEVPTSTAKTTYTIRNYPTLRMEQSTITRLIHLIVKTTNMKEHTSSILPPSPVPVSHLFVSSKYQAQPNQQY